MSGYQYGIVSVEDYIDCGLRLRLSAGRTLILYREMGGSIRTREFYTRWYNREKALGQMKHGSDATERSA